VYIIKRGNKYLQSHGYDSKVGYRYNWTENKDNVRIYYTIQEAEGTVANSGGDIIKIKWLEYP
jgi:hypothetical protein